MVKKKLIRRKVVVTKIQWPFDFVGGGVSENMGPKVPGISNHLSVFFVKPKNSKNVGFMSF